MGAYLGGAAQSSGEGFILGLILAPVALPVSAAIGAGMAHSEEEVEAAVAAFNRVGQNEKLFLSIDRRFIEALDKDSATNWACIEAASVAAEDSCSGYRPVARIVFRPAFRLQADGAYNPDILFIGDIVTSLSVNFAAPNGNAETVLEAKWKYREELGEFFELAMDDARLLRHKIDSILDRIANRIAKDLYLDPQPETFSRKKEPTGQMTTEIPEGAVVRVEQGTEIPSFFTHGIVQPKGRRFSEKCWIESINGKPTGHSYDTPWMSRNVAVKAGRVQLDVSCLRHRGSINEKLEEHSIEVVLEPGVSYVTNGQTFEPVTSGDP